MIGKRTMAAGGLALGLIGVLTIGGPAPVEAQDAQLPLLPVGREPREPIIVVGAGTAKSGTTKRTTFKTVSARQEREVLIYFNLNDACRALDYEVSVTRPAKFGAIRLGKREFKEIGRFKEAIAVSNPDDPRRKCEISGNQGKLVSYVPMSSYVGRDSFKLTIRDHDFIHEIDIDLNVKDE